MAAFLGLVTAGSGALVMHALGREGAELPILAMLLVSAGAAAGSWLGGRPRDAQRSLGLVPVGALGLLAALVWAASTPAEGSLPLLPCLLLGLMGGLANVPLRSAFQAAVPADARGNSMAVTNLFVYSLTTLLSLLVFALAWLHWLTTPLSQLAFLAVLSGLGTILASWLLRAQALDLLSAIYCWCLGPWIRQSGLPSHGSTQPVGEDLAYTDERRRSAAADIG